MEDIRVSEPRFSHQIDLICEAPWGIFLINIIEDFPAVTWTSCLLQILPVPFPHFFVHAFVFVEHQVAYEKRPARLEEAVVRITEPVPGVAC